MTEPIVIQGGMGAAVSNWKLARAVSLEGQLGVVSGTALDNVMARRLQAGDPDGSMRWALERFPAKGAAQRILKRYFIEGGKPAGTPFKAVPMFSLDSPEELVELTIAANFAEVFLAKENHRGLVGINYLEKIQLPTLPSLYGAILAGVDYVLMGAGIPRAIPALLDQLARHEKVTLKVNVQGAAAGEEFHTVFDPNQVLKATRPLKRPRFLAIVSSEVLAATLASPTGFPFKVVQLEGTLSEAAEYAARPRICDLGYLRTPYKRKDGTVGYRCPGEPVESYLQKEGKEEDTRGRKCLCNGLMANIGLGQSQRSGYGEKPLVTSGDDLARITRFLKPGRLSYTALDVIQYLLGTP